MVGCVALAAAQAGDDLLRLALIEKFPVVGVGHIGTGHGEKVGLAFGNGLLAVVRIKESRRGGNSLLNTCILEILRHIQERCAGLCKASRMLIVQLHGPDGQYVNETFHLPGKGDRIIQRPALRLNVMAGYGCFNGEIPAALLLDLSAQQFCKPDAVFKAAAEFIGPPVGDGREHSARKHHPVGHVDIGAVKATVCHILGKVGVFFYQFIERLGRNLRFIGA